ncbi:MAG: 3-isopropylmalate dehydratase small subunit [Thermomonas sp.]
MPVLDTLVARTLVMPECNIDTDQIIPARFLTTTTRDGLGRFAFNDWRYLADGSDNPDFVFNRPGHTDLKQAGAKILIAGHNFGCGSSREHAPWALLDLGLRAVVSSQIADIFRSNALKNGLLPIVLEADIVAELLAQPGIELRIDVAKRSVTLPDGRIVHFELDAFAQTCLLEGVDQLGYLLKHDAAISAFEHSAKPHLLTPIATQDSTHAR